MSAEMKLDLSHFQQDFGNLTREMLEKAEEGMMDAGRQLKLDADEVAPTTPLLSGQLRSSGRVEDKGTHNALIVEVSYRSKYAAKWHEEEAKNWSEPGSGSKYLEKKLIGNRNEYIGIVADEIKKAKA